jgi:thiamine-phosphate pyrophosphorylase
LQVDFNLYLISDRRQCKDKNLLACVEQALRAGVRAVQLREKDLSTRERYELAKPLRSLTSAFGAALIINGDAALARAVGADGVHLPQDGLPADVCRSALSPGMLIAVSTHSMQQAKDAEAKGADFITFGPVYSTPSKAQYGPPVGVDTLRSVCREIRIPVFGLGGISESRIEMVLSAGAAGVALISAILAAPDIEGAASDFVARLRQADQHRTTPSTKG